MYSIGKHRLFYQSNDNNEQTVMAEVLTPSLEHRGPWSMTFVEMGLYYLDIWFTTYGSHVFRVYENDDLKLKDILVVNNAGLVVYPNGDRVI